MAKIHKNMSVFFFEEIFILKSQKTYFGQILITLLFWNVHEGSGKLALASKAEIRQAVYSTKKVIGYGVKCDERTLK